MSHQTMQEALEELRDRRAQSLSPGSERSIAKQRARGKMTARERVELLLDPGTFMESASCGAPSSARTIPMNAARSATASSLAAA